jgi:bifunctional aspartokinase / homoserine dehydrogenase 1
MSKWVVHKFGGTSVANADRYKTVASIIKKTPDTHRKGIVVSAMSKVTDALIELTELARKRDSLYENKMTALLDKHNECVDTLFAKPEAERLKSVFKRDMANIAEILKGVWHAKSCSSEVQELVSGHGEVWSAQIMSAQFQNIGVKTAWLDAREVLVIEPLERTVNVLWSESEAKTLKWFNAHPDEVVVITGFVASTPEGVATTLKRNGSDFSAAIFGRLLEASEIFIWTDVDGVMSADPRLVPDAVVLPQVSYSEAIELAYFGAKVIHPDTMGPAVQKKIPIWIKNTFAPDKAGTCISAKATLEPPVKGFATIDKVALINLEGRGMIGVPGVAQRLFGALKDVGVSVVMISQASSEHSICFAVLEQDGEAAKKAVHRAFEAEIHRHEIETVSLHKDCSVLAMVGDGMAQTPGMSGRLFSALGKARTNVLAIAQGSSERNISVVLPREAIHRAVRAAHSAFFLSNQTLSVGVIGTGTVGQIFLNQLAERFEALRSERGIDVRLRAITNSKKSVTNETGLDIKKWPGLLDGAKSAMSIDQFVQYVNESHYPHSVIIDLTASEETTSRYLDWIKKGLNVITANKKAGSGDLKYYKELQTTSRALNRYFLYETTVGAGLPVLRTLRDLIQTGDQLIDIEGILSGTLSYLFNVYDGSVPFSEVVLDAKKRGFTEPDPREDLSGTDVGRKLVILAREAGLEIERSAVKVESLIPKALQSISTQEFLDRVQELDAEMKKVFTEAKAKNCVLRYVANIKKDGSASVSLKALPQTHPFARLSGSDNILLFRTKRYDKQPMVIQGPGAGPEVTAAGIFSELLRLADYLGAPQ